MPNHMGGRGDIEQALQMVGELLKARGEQFQIVVIGGAAVNLLGLVARATTDVDILAFATRTQDGARHLGPPDEPLPRPLQDAASIVAEDLGLDPRWLNTGPASQWRTGLPPGLDTRVHWREYGGLTVGLVDRYDLVFFKLYAAADDIGVRSVHFQDLVALRPTAGELEAAAAWVQAQDPSPDFANVIAAVVEHARSHGNRSR